MPSDSQVVGQAWFKANKDGNCFISSRASAARIQRIENRTDSFYTLVNGKQAEIVVAVYGGRKYLKTESDGYAPNNLLTLRECSNCTDLS